MRSIELSFQYQGRNFRISQESKQVGESKSYPISLGIYEGSRRHLVAGGTWEEETRTFIATTAYSDTVRVDGRQVGKVQAHVPYLAAEALAVLLDSGVVDIIQTDIADNRSTGANRSLVHLQRDPRWNTRLVVTSAEHGALRIRRSR